MSPFGLASAREWMTNNRGRTTDLHGWQEGQRYLTASVKSSQETKNTRPNIVHT